MRNESKPVVYGPAEPADIDAIADVQLHANLMSDFKRRLIKKPELEVDAQKIQENRAEWRGYFNRVSDAKTLRVHKAVLGSALIGSVFAYEPDKSVADVKSMTIDSLCVDPQYWRNGVGAGLMHSIEQDLKGLGVQKLFLDVESGNKLARKFYEAHGWNSAQQKRRVYNQDEQIFFEVMTYEKDLV